MRVLPLLVASSFLIMAFAGCLGGGGNVATDTEIPPVFEGVSPVVFDAIDREVMWVASSIDGALLRVDVYRPVGDGPFPVILLQSPYWSFAGDGKAMNEFPAAEISYFAPRGYAVALGEMRGTRDSGGCWDFGGDLDQQDGYDVVEALGAAAWSNGNVGMIGGSHVGMSQIAAAVLDPPSLKAIVPVVAVSDWYRYLHKDGAPYVVNRGTPPAYFGVHASPSIPDGHVIGPDWVLTQAEVVCADNVIHLSKSAELHGDKDAYWQERDLIAKSGNIRAATFLVHGLQDENVKTDHFLDFWQALPEDTPKKMWIGQFGHAYPPHAEWRDDVHRWFDHFLLGHDNGILDDLAVTVEDNTGRGRMVADWPDPGMSEASWMLDGADLLTASNGSATAQVSYLSVPFDDRGRGGLLDDLTVVRFQAAATPGPLHMAGEARLHLDGILDGPTGRWIAVLYDVAPDGTAREITRSYIDARHRDGLESGQDVPAGEVQEYLLRFFPRDHVVETGHALRLDLRGADMGCSVDLGDADCRGTGIVPVERLVTHTVVTGPGSGTRLVLPLVDGLGEPERELTRYRGLMDDPPE